VFFFPNTKLLIFGNFYFIIGKSLNSFSTYNKEINEWDSVYRGYNDTIVLKREKK